MKNNLILIIGIIVLSSCNQSVDDFIKTSNCQYILEAELENDISIAESPRFQKDITLSNKFDSIEIIDLAKCQIKKTIQEKGICSVSIMIRSFDKPKDVIFSIDFAPYGKWENANKNATLEEYSISVKNWTRNYFN